MKKFARIISGAMFGLAVASCLVAVLLMLLLHPDSLIVELVYQGF